MCSCWVHKIRRAFNLLESVDKRENSREMETPFHSWSPSWFLHLPPGCITAAHSYPRILRDLLPVSVSQYRHKRSPIKPMGQPLLPSRPVQSMSCVDLDTSHSNHIINICRYTILRPVQIPLLLQTSLPPPENTAVRVAAWRLVLHGPSLGRRSGI